MNIKEKIEKAKKYFLNSKDRKRNIENLVIFLVGLIIVISVSGSLFSKNEEEAVQTYSKNTEVFDADEFEKKLAGILSNIQGAGDVAVMISYKTGVETVPLLDTKDNKTLTEENANGTNRKTEQGQVETSIIFNEKDNGNKEPYISKTIMPQVEGVIVTCRGAQNQKVKKDIISAVVAVTGVEQGKVQVFSKESE